MAPCVAVSSQLQSPVVSSFELPLCENQTWRYIWENPYLDPPGVYAHSMVIFMSLSVTFLLCCFGRSRFFPAQGFVSDGLDYVTDEWTDLEGGLLSLITSRGDTGELESR